MELFKSSIANVNSLNAIDFSFHNSKTNLLTHGLHPYPAKYIPQIPNALIQELTEPGDTVADIFCGSGTTLVEAMLLKRNALGIDANPLACLISQAKTTRLAPSDKDHLSSLLYNVERKAQDIIGSGKSLFSIAGPFTSSEPRPDHPAIEFWFDSHVVEELAEIKAWCYSLPTTAAQTVSLVAFSSIIVAVSKQDSDTRYVRRDKGILPGQTMARFARAIKSAIASVEAFTESVPLEAVCEIYRSSILDCPTMRKFDLMVCSPPYPNAFSYHLYHMTRMVWLGMDQPKFKQEEIGSHRKYSSKGVKGANVDTFKLEMSKILGWLSSHLKQDGHACFVIGDSTIRGELILNTDLIAEAGLIHGFEEITRIPRKLQSTKKSFNPVIGKIRQENILILQNKVAGAS